MNEQKFRIHYARNEAGDNAGHVDGIKRTDGTVFVNAGNPDFEREYASMQALCDTLKKRFYNHPWRIEWLPMRLWRTG